MKTPKPSVRIFAFGIVIVFFASPSTVFSVCDYQPDAPDCTCFNDTPGIWDAGGPSATLPIQAVALDTLGTRESCHTAPPVDDDCGKPYYQLTLGMNTEAGALTASYALSEGTPTFPDRQEWCSETVSYWHREAGIPYTLGYRNEWREDWRNYSVPEMRVWYEREEEDGGRGRWIRSSDVDYDIAELGVTIPTPGAYMAISCLHPNPTASWCDPAVLDKYHSLMVDEIWIHRDGNGDVFRVEATFLEGNSGRQVKNSRRLDDIFSLTTRGSQWLSYNNGSDGVADTADDWGVKIYGFGIALDAAGNPIFDGTRLHYVDHPTMRRVYLPMTRPVTDEPWNSFYMSIKDKLAAYTKALKAAGGPSITCSAGVVKTEKTPNGAGEIWHFPSTLQNEEVVVEFDFLNKNPLLIRGLTLFWDSSFIPRGYKVYFGLDKEHYNEAAVSDMSGLKPLAWMTPIPVTARLSNAQGDVRFVKFVFPKDTFSQEATLTEMIVDYSHGPSEDTSDVPEDIPMFVDVRPGDCPNHIIPDADDNLLIAVLGSEKFSAGGIEANTIRLNGQNVKFQSVSYKDLTMPFIGTDPGCHAEGGDGLVDLVINYKATDVIQALGLKFKKGKTTPIVVSGQFNANYDNQPFVGQDFVMVQGVYWPMFLPAITNKEKP